MKFKLKSTSRLIIVFILTMVISGGILTYLGVISISNLRELTEKKVIEEQSSIAVRIQAKFNENLEKIANQAFAFVEDQEESGCTCTGQFDSTGQVERFYITDPEGNFLCPAYHAELKIGMEPAPGQAYLDAYTSAQRQEFQAKDYRKAAGLYSGSLVHASSDHDSARSLNALGRVNRKMEDDTGSFHYYAKVVSDFASVLDNNGFPYAYYALSSLLTLYESDQTLNILPEVISFLNNLQEGIVPLNNTTGDMLDRISSLTGTLLKDSACTRLVENRIASIDATLSFIKNNGRLIRKSLEQWRSGQSQSRIVEYLVIQGTSSDPGTLVLIDPARPNPTGCCLNLESIWADFIKSGLPDESEFDYSISLSKTEGESRSGNVNLVHYATLSPWFPEFEIRIGLQDEDMIDQFVKRRRWSYGIALVLLLGAMLIGILLILRDIAREKHLGRLRSDFVSNVTHELKTPLTSIHLFTESVYLDRVEKDSAKKEYLRIILNETERLKRMINNILDFSKKEKGKLEYKYENVDVTSLIQSALTELDYWLQELNFTVQTDLSEGMQVPGDPDALKQVVINLLDNAMKFSGSKKEINIRMTPENGWVRIEFSDKGIGIPEDQLDHIFEKFYRVNHELAEGIGGTGLGLTVVKEIIEDHGGKIYVESVLEEGSTFILLLKSI